ncbi:serine/threonine-protein kinase [Actinoplanes sp. NPDC051859]|uniref:serine/threonine-protein kinase n=1 Tax=Actinoplanes sp. NPDC051859 TaxID=3363909 RepID=UPI00378BF478
MRETEPSSVAVAAQAVVAGRYRLLTLIASGGMGRVWRARDELLDRDVAVKEVAAPAGLPHLDRHEIHLRALREARAAARLDHPAVVRVFDVVQTTGRSWIVMEYVESRSLHQVITEEGPLSHREAARVGLAVLMALRAAHGQEVMHLDVKPHNVLLTAQGRVVLTDFGLAAFGAVARRETTTEPLIGSPYFLAPERLREGAGDARTDLWSLGATLYAAVEGRPPFKRASVEESLAAVLADAPDPPRHPGPLHPVIAGLLNRDPAHRTNAARAQMDLEKVTQRAVGSAAVPAPRRPRHDDLHQAGPPQTATASPPAESSAPEPRSRWNHPGRQTGILLVVIALAAAIGAAVTATVDRNDDPRPAPQTSRPTATAAGAAAAPCALGRRESLAAASAAKAPAGGSQHVDPAGFTLPVPKDWTRTADASRVSFCDPGGVRVFTVQPGLAPTGDPLRHWQTVEQQALSTGTLPGYQKVSMGVLLVAGGGADWEYTWQPPSGPRLHTHQILRAVDNTRSYLLAWTTPDQDWEANLIHQRTFVGGLRDRSSAPATWSVPAPKQ